MFKEANHVFYILCLSLVQVLRVVWLGIDRKHHEAKSNVFVLYKGAYSGEPMCKEGVKKGKSQSRCSCLEYD